MSVSQQARSLRGGVVGTIVAALTLLSACLTTGVITAASAYALPCEGHNNIPGSVPASNSPDTRNGDMVGKPITPDEALARAVDWEKANPTYCQEDPYPDRYGKMYRADCSGFVSMAWQIAEPRTTGTLIDPAISHRIDISEVQPGDALINDHHTELVWAVEGGTIETIGFGSTPVDHWGPVPMWVADGLYDAYRYNNMQVITDEIVRQLIRENVPEPDLRLQPPNGRSVVNLETMFRINPDGDADADNMWEATVPVVIDGRQVGNLSVRLRATATNFHWNFASPKRKDEPATTPANADTTYPGAAFDQAGQKVIHKYMTADVFHPNVDVNWTNYQYQVVGQEDEGWHNVDGEHVDEGPETALTIREFSSVLTR
jgi:hypothetical protein